MKENYLWQDPAFPHFYSNPAVVGPLEDAFRASLSAFERLLDSLDESGNRGTRVDDVLTEEIVANSAIEGVILDRESVQSSFISNLQPLQQKEEGAVALTKMALAHFDQPLSHELLFSMHREILKGSAFPPESIGIYVGDMKVISGRRLDQDYRVVHEGVSQDLVHEKMTEFIDWYNQCPRDTPLLNAVQGHVHFETLHPFCDGNGRIGRSLILMGLCRDLGRNTPLALSRSFNADLKNYYQQFEVDLDLTRTIQAMSPSYENAVQETCRILDLTAFRTQMSDLVERLNTRQQKVLNRLIDYELKGGFEGGLNNAKYQKMTAVSERTALRDLNDLQELGLIKKTGELKGTRYFLNIPPRVHRL